MGVDEGQIVASLQVRLHFAAGHFFDTQATGLKEGTGACPHQEDAAQTAGYAEKKLRLSMKAHATWLAPAAPVNSPRVASD
jgi:hypothetical protein